MTKSEGFSFDEWFGSVQMAVLDLCGYDLQDEDSVRADYEADRDSFDVAEQISEEMQ